MIHQTRSIKTTIYTEVRDPQRMVYAVDKNFNKSTL